MKELMNFLKSKAGMATILIILFMIIVLAVVLSRPKPQKEKEEKIDHFTLLQRQLGDLQRNIEKDIKKLNSLQ